MDFILRKANPADKPNIEKLFIEMLQTIYRKEDVKGYEAGDLDKFFEGKGDWICVAEADERVVAFLSIEAHHEPEDYLYLDDFSVTRDYRSCGIGTALIKTAMQYAEDKGGLPIFLHVEKSNTRAYQLYRRFGFRDDKEDGSRIRMKKEMRKKLLYATGNAAKLAAMQARLETLGIELTGLQDVKRDNPEMARKLDNMDVTEDGRTPLENAKKKALAYYQVLRTPLFSCDSGLYIENIPEEEQPGVHVRMIHGKYLSDEEMLEYYTGLAKKYGDLKARYRNAICLVEDETHIYSAMEESMASEPFLITSKPHKDGILKKGFPLDCISVHIGTGKYYYDLEGDELNQIAVEDGFLEFFRRYLKELQKRC